MEEKREPGQGQRYYLTGPEGMRKTTANNRTHTDSRIHVYTDMHVGHVPDVVLKLSRTGGGVRLLRVPVAEM